MTSKTAVHFGAGNIGRGFIGAALQDAGYHVVFADVNEGLLEKLKGGQYSVNLVGKQGESKTYSKFSVINSREHHAELIESIADADIVTTSVGASVLPSIAPTIALAAAQRQKKDKLIVMACENAVNATDQLGQQIMKHAEVSEKLALCNTAVDRIVPEQAEGTEPDVSVEEFAEWVIETKNLKNKPQIPAAKFVKNLAPFIERKLFTVNTAHCSVAYMGAKKGFTRTGHALKDPEIKKKLVEVLEETSKALELRHQIDGEEQRNYVQTTISRLENPLLDDAIDRVARDPMRKLSRDERIVSPAATLAENEIPPVALLMVYSCALRFENPKDDSATKLQHLVANEAPGELVRIVSGLDYDHPLFPYLLGVVDLVQNKASSNSK